MRILGAGAGAIGGYFGGRLLESGRAVVTTPGSELTASMLRDIELVGRRSRPTAS